MDWTVYGALVAGLLAFSAAAGFLAVRVLQGWRTLRRARRHLAKSLAALAASSERTGDIVEQISDQRELETSLARLRVATRQLNVLREAVDEVTESVAGVTAVYPRK